MQRRNILKMMGALGAGGAAAMGTGAFTSASAERNVSVEVSGDASALLTIKSAGNHGDYIHDDNGSGEFAIDLTGSDQGASGVNANAITVIEDLFKVKNKGTQAVDLDVTPLSFVDTDGPNTLCVMVVPQSSFPSVTLGVGSEEVYSLIVDEFSLTNTSVSVDSTINFVAEAN